GGGPQARGGAGEGVEADGGGGWSRRAGVVGEHEGKLALRARRGGEPRPKCCTSRRSGDPVLRRLMRDAGKFESFDLALLGLEGDRGGEQSPVKLRQHNLHGEVRLGETARRVLPGFAA